jgi:hypothetical protein
MDNATVLLLWNTATEQNTEVKTSRYNSKHPDRISDYTFCFLLLVTDFSTKALNLFPAYLNAKGAFKHLHSTSQGTISAGDI